MKVVPLWILVLSLWVSGCGPTYPRDTLSDSLVQLCRKEYGVDVTVKRVGNTLGVHVPLEKLFDSTLQLSPEVVGNQLNSVVLSTSRVVLSTNDPPDFYVIVAQDTRIPGIELKLIRYVQDIRRLHYYDISRSEFDKRGLFELGLGLGIFRDKKGEDFFLEEVRLEDFLARQMAHRIRSGVGEDERLRGKIELRSAAGEFMSYPSFRAEQPLSGKFMLSLEMEKRSTDLWGEMKPEDEERILTLVLEVVLKVLRGYQFEGYDTVEIKTSFLGQPLILDRKLLELYRKKKIRLGDLLLPKNFNLPSHDPELLFKQ